MPRVLVLVEQFPVTSETFVVDHVRGLAASGFEVHVGTFKLNRPELDALRARTSETFAVHEVPVEGDASSARRTASALTALLPRAPLAALRSPRLRGNAWLARGVRPFLRRIAPDLVHAHFGPTGVVAALAAPRTLPLIVDFHGFDVTSEVLEHGWEPYRATLGSAVAVVHSTFVHDLVARNTGLPCRLVPLGVDLGLFSRVERSDTWPAPVRLLTCGRAVIQKGHHVALDALALLRHRDPGRRIELTVIGDGPELPGLRRRAALLGVQDAVQFAGAQDPPDVAAAMGVADVLLVPSLSTADGRQEAFSRVAVEGMARGMLVIGTTSGGLPETIGTGGRVVPQGDALALADELERCLQRETPAGAARRATTRAADFSFERSRDAYARVTRERCGTTP